MKSVNGLGWGVVLLTGLVGCGQEAKEPAPAPAPEQAEISAVEQEARFLNPPAGCTEVSMGELYNGIELTPVQYERQPTFRGDLVNFGGNATRDEVRIRLDMKTHPGLYDLAQGGANTFTCDQCVVGYQDIGTSAQKLFVAESGALLLALQVSAQQTIGALSNVVLRESVVATPTSGPYTGSAVVPGGECRWIRFATWNTVRPGGCDPRQGSLTSNLPGTACVADDYAATDGTLQRALGTKTQGEACTATPGDGEYALATTDCKQGFACTDLVSDDAQCLKTCDYMAANPGCPSGTICGVYGLCIEQAVLEPFGFAFDTALIGEPCSQSFTEFCGVEGARGTCFDPDGAAGPQGATCHRYARARSDCGPGEELGYIYYPLVGGGGDRGYGFCYHDGR
ncbi:hypothetical protein LZ198_06380 [Myxococcus sp. K15C18031901]|uniref:hypothetical protein n=1 Tax=Myxococcus dinghuensis TaxID=2906761 RepID=UPI0020A7D423|nr:hypothetical protein [Myxococcus dinghuensis]MCP3098503.1 hypothetical protein [Myxococcus dinghuensis]